MERCVIWMEVGKPVDAVAGRAWGVGLEPGYFHTRVPFKSVSLHRQDEEWGVGEPHGGSHGVIIAEWGLPRNIPLRSPALYFLNSLYGLIAVKVKNVRTRFPCVEAFGTDRQRRSVIRVVTVYYLSVQRLAEHRKLIRAQIIVHSPSSDLSHSNFEGHLK